MAKAAFDDVLRAEHVGLIIVLPSPANARDAADVKNNLDVPAGGDDRRPIAEIGADNLRAECLGFSAVFPAEGANLVASGD